MDTIPAINPRRPYHPDGPVESDRDFVENNFEACVWFLENFLNNSIAVLDFDASHNLLTAMNCKTTVPALELWAIRNISDSTVDKLTKQFNSQVSK